MSWKSKVNIVANYDSSSDDDDESSESSRDCNATPSPKSSTNIAASDTVADTAYEEDNIIPAAITSAAINTGTVGGSKWRSAAAPLDSESSSESSDKSAESSDSDLDPIDGDHQRVSAEDFIQACANGNVTAASGYIDGGIDINSKGDMNLTGLHVAAIGGHLKMAQWLLDHGASLSARTSNGMTPLHFACEYYQTPIAIFLIRMGADISLQNSHKLSALHYVCITNNLKLAPQIPHYMINSTSGDSLSLLHCAADSGSCDIINYLIDHGAEVRE
jgi:hypothetical protein